MEEKNEGRGKNLKCGIDLNHFSQNLRSFLVESKVDMYVVQRWSMGLKLREIAPATRRSQEVLAAGDYGDVDAWRR